MSDLQNWCQSITEQHRIKGARGAIAAALHSDDGHRAAVLTSFGIESAVLLKLVADVDPAAPVVFLETGKHFSETLDYAHRLIRLLGLTDVRYIPPSQDVLAGADPSGDLWFRDPDRCCFLRKVMPMRAALAGYSGYISGRKRFQSSVRASLPITQIVDDQVQINPIGDWDQTDIDEAFETFGLPKHPLWASGYVSVGCAPCTARPASSDDPRAGRWPGFEKTECGIHESYWENLKKQRSG